MSTKRVNVLLSTVFALCSAGSATTESPIRIGTDVQLFCDLSLIEKLEEAQLSLHSPLPREVAIRFDAPWENGEGGYATVLAEPDGYRLYYSAGGELAREYTCVAFSKDGVQWTRPNLGLIEYNGSRDNNIIWTAPNRKAYGESHNFSPFKDANPSAPPDQRYKAVGLARVTLPGQPKSHNALAGFISADGIRWKRLQNEPIIADGAFDSHNVAFWDSALQEYVCYLRIGRDGVRSVARTTSKDFIHWTPSEPLDFGDAPLEHFYTNGIEPYLRNPRQYLGFPMRFIPPQQRSSVGIDHRRTDGLSDTVFISSRDGLHFNRFFMEAFIRPGMDTYNWGGAHGNMTPAWHVVQTGAHELSIYWLEHYGYHTLWVPGTQPGSLVPLHREKGKDGSIIPQLRRGTLRIDGFVSVHAPFKGGEMITHLLSAQKGKLALNMSTSSVGSVKVEVQDADGRPLPGYGLADAEEIWGDEIARIVSWKGRTELDPPAGRPFRLRFVMRDADLYSLSIAAEQLEK